MSCRLTFMRMVQSLLIVGFLSACSNETPSPVKTLTNVSADQTHVFEKFQSLSGLYDLASREGSKASVAYETISKNSAVTERWTFPSDEGDLIELTIFHMDNGMLKATHYCASGIQSNMVLSEITAEGRYVFGVETTTNQASASTAFNSGFAYEFEGSNIRRDEYWSKDGKITSSDLVLSPR